MTTIVCDDVTLATAEDLRVAVKHALDRAGCTFAQLEEQARTGRFASVQARMAWVAIGTLGEYRPA